MLFILIEEVTKLKWTYSPDDEKAVIDHVNSFSKVQSHYTRAKNDREYLSQDLNYL